MKKNILYLSYALLIPLTVCSFSRAETNIYNNNSVEDIEKINIKENAIISIGRKFYASGLYKKHSERKAKEKVQYKIGYLTTDVNVRKKPNKKSRILEVYCFGKKIKYYQYNKNWAAIKYGANVAYIKSSYISDNVAEYKEYYAPKNNGFKSYMSYTAITAKKSPQYKLQEMACTGKYGIRQYCGRYCVAIGTAFSAFVGTYFDLVLDNGEIIPCIVGDIKDDKDTEDNNIVTLGNGCISEFIVDIGSLQNKARKNGDISYCNDGWNSSVSLFRIYNKNVFD